MSYVLKNENEAKRLDEQSQSESFNVATEIRDIDIPENVKILEVGCGAGSLIGHLNANHNITAHGCDLQQEHINYCKNKFDSSIHFFQHDIVNQDLDEKYDLIFMRFVAHHLGTTIFKKALINMKKALNENGKIVIIDVDGLLTSVGTTNPYLLESFDKIQKNFQGDLNIGKKIPSILEELGFNDVKFDLRPVVFSEPKSRQEEIGQWKLRFNFAEKSFVKILGSEFEFTKFKKEYLKEIENPNIPFFFNKFIVTAAV